MVGGGPEFHDMDPLDKPVDDNAAFWID